MIDRWVDRKKRNKKFSYRVEEMKIYVKKDDIQTCVAVILRYSQNEF